MLEWSASGRENASVGGCGCVRAEEKVCLFRVYEILGFPFCSYKVYFEGVGWMKLHGLLIQ